MKPRVLFVCIHNSARSQMAEAFLSRFGADLFHAESAGIEPGVINPLVVTAMTEIGYDLSKAKTTSVAEVLESGRDFAFVVTVCDETSAERCPVFPGATRRLHWGFPDPSALTGSVEERLVRIREIRAAIAHRIEAWCVEQRAALT